MAKRIFAWAAALLLVLGVSGRVTQRVIRAGKDGEHD